MPIRQRDDGYQVDVCWKGKRIQRQAPNEVEAQKLHDQLLEDLKAKAEPKERKAWTLGEAVAATIEDVWSQGRSLQAASLNAAAAKKFFGASTTLDRITAERLQEWVKELRKLGNSNATINRKLACVSRVMTHAKDMGRLVGDKPKVKRQREGLGRIRWITAEEETAIFQLLTQWGKQDAHDLVAVGLDMGMRPGRSELMRFTARDVNLQTGMVSIWQNKTDHPRSVPMTTRARAVIERRSKVHPSGPLFPYDKEWLRYTWDRVKTTLGLAEDEEFIPYAMRHTFASRLVQRGCHINVLKQLMGHKSIQTTMRYAHLAPHNLAGAVALLEPSAAATQTA